MIDLLKARGCMLACLLACLLQHQEVKRSMKNNWMENFTSSQKPEWKERKRKEKEGK